MKNLLLFTFCVLMSGTAFGQGTETFTGITGTTSSYTSRTWTGDDGSTWTATNARTDQDITSGNDAITMNDDKINTYVESGTIAGGIGNITITTQRKFSGGSGTLNVLVNGNNVGTVPYDATPLTTTITGVDVSGDVVIRINNDIGGSSSGGADRVAIDNLTWTAFSLTTPSLLLSGISGNTSEAGTMATFEVSLNTQPASDVVIDVVSGNTAENTIPVSPITFTMANYNTPQTISVAGVDDGVIDGDQTTTITLTVDDAASDDDYDGLSATIDVVNEDDECNITNPVATPIACSGDDARFMVTWTAVNASPAFEVDIDGNGFQTIANGGEYIITGPTSAATGVSFTVRDVNQITCSASGTVDIPACPFIAPAVVINEIDCDQSGNSDSEEFVELYGTPNQSLDGLVLVFFNGSDDRSYEAYDLDGESLDANGFFTIGNVVGAAVTFTGNDRIQNGPDAVALYLGDGTDFPNDTDPSTTNLIDVIAYDTDDANDSGLLTPLAITDQYNENENGEKETQSIQRFPDGSANIITANASPAAVNLPVELISFTATPNQKSIDLAWETATEENNAFFAIERSANGIDFEEIAMVEGAGTTYEAQTYSYSDVTATNGINYYRLRQVDFDGGFEYHKVVAAILNGKAIDVLIVPSQVNNQFDVVFGEATSQATQMDIFTIDGKLVKSETVNTNSSRQTIDVTNFQSGLYIIRMNVNNTIITKRFVKL